MIRPLFRPAVLVGGLVGALVFQPAIPAAVGQTVSGAPQPSYTAELLRCSTFAEQVESDIRIAGAGPTRSETAGRLEPETDGLIGGRWRGTLGPTGEAVLLTTPFMPPDILLVADLSSVLADFFPPLPPRTLAVGEAWSDSTGRWIRRDADRDGARWFRWEIDAMGTMPEGTVGAERLREEGSVSWRDGVGPEFWRRHIVVDTEARRGLSGGAMFRSRVTQEILVIRVTEAGCGE
ncbi:MAG: hypothetical protein AAB075_03575 [Gemmatimonadota bacterium]